MWLEAEEVARQERGIGLLSSILPRILLDTEVTEILKGFLHHDHCRHCIFRKHLLRHTILYFPVHILASDPY